MAMIWRLFILPVPATASPGVSFAWLLRLEKKEGVYPVLLFLYLPFG